MQIIFAGTPEFAATTLAALLGSPHTVVAVYTQPDRKAGRGRKLRPSAVKQLALEHGLPVYQPLSLKDPDAQRQLAELQADLMVVVAYGLILPQAVLDLPGRGCINVHASLLPRWRGAAPIQRAILAGDRETGVSIMQMEVGLDTGPVLSEVRTRISDQDTGASLHDRLADLGAVALTEVLGTIEAGRPQARAQDEQQANYAHKLTKSEAWLDWQRPAIELQRQVRAFDPWPVAQTRTAGGTVRVWAAATQQTATTTPPGTVISLDAEGLLVACGDGVLCITRLQLPGGKPLQVGDWLNAGKRDIEVGSELLGPP
jgi:methionyl-tRNA formyltransferase